jgi:hypothetical protein
MNHRGLMFYTTLIVLGSAMLVSQAARQRRAWTHRPRGQSPHGQGREHDDLSMHTGNQPDLDTSITSRSIPP